MEHQRQPVNRSVHCQVERPLPLSPRHSDRFQIGPDHGRSSGSGHPESVLELLVHLLIREGHQGPALGSGNPRLVPLGTDETIRSTRADRQTSALREGSRLQSEAEPSEIGLRTSGTGSGTCQLHRDAKSLSSHPTTVIGHRDVRGLPTVEPDLHIASTGRDRVVNYVSQSRPELISDSTQGCHQVSRRRHFHLMQFRFLQPSRPEMTLRLPALPSAVDGDACRDLGSFLTKHSRLRAPIHTGSCANWIPWNILRAAMCICVHRNRPTVRISLAPADVTQVSTGSGRKDQRVPTVPPAASRTFSQKPTGMSMSSTTTWTSSSSRLSRSNGPVR